MLRRALLASRRLGRAASHVRGGQTARMLRIAAPAASSSLAYGLGVGGGLSAAYLLFSSSECSAEASASDGVFAPSGRRVEDDYELGVKLGCGHFATVHKGRCKRTGAEVAIKVCALSPLSPLSSPLTPLSSDRWFPRRV